MRASCVVSFVTSSTVRSRAGTPSLVDEGGRAIAIMVMPSRSTARDVCAVGGLKSNVFAVYCTSGGVVSGDGSEGGGLASVAA